jgi:uncharacterized protein (DUF39 family)
MKSIKEINQKIKNGDAVVLTAAEMTQYVKENGLKKAAEEVDVVTTGTFGAMCSSGAFLNFGHSDPPIKMNRTFLNNVEAYSGLAAVDAYMGATQLNKNPQIGMDYGGAHLIEDLIKGKEIELLFKLVSISLFPEGAEPTKLKKVNLTFDAQNMPKNAHYKIFSRLIQL